jgi:DNA-binding transcriptional LysR family regulator
VLHPGIRVSLRHAPAGDVVAMLATGAADVAVAALGADALRAAADLDVATLSEEPLRVVTPPGHPLAAAGERTAADLRGAALVLTERGTALREAVLEACMAAGFSPVPLLEVSDPGTLRDLVHAGLGVSVVPASWLQGPGAAVDSAPLAEPASRHRVALLAPRAGGSPAGRLLHEHLRGDL